MNNSNTPSVNPDPSVLIVSGDVEDTITKAIAMTLKNAIDIAENSESVEEIITRLKAIRASI